MKIATSLWASAVLLVSQIAVASDPPNITKIGKFTFTVANGLEFERVAEESLIQWPIAATYHASGDLLMLECHWNRQSVQKQLESRPHKIVRLADADRDGFYDKRTVIAEELGFPEGIMVLGKDLLVTTPPQILRLSDSDGDGFFESRDVWFDGATLTHCANDLHGPMLGPDGWVYWTKGAFAEQNHELIRRPDLSDPEPIPSKAAHIYRRHPQGGPIERLMTGGMDNPSDITFSPEGEIFFCSTFLHNPGHGLRDGIAHAPRGGLFGKQHQVIDGHIATGKLLQPIANLGPAAPASVNYLSSDTLVRETPWIRPSQDDRYLVSAQFNLQKIGLHRLVPRGASFNTEDFDLVSADQIDFHPVDILEEPDGSLLVFDTGGWYDLCCPSSGSDHSIAKGGIYRLKKKTKASSDSKSAKSLASKPVMKPKQAQLWELARRITAKASDAQSRDTILSMLNDEEGDVQQTAACIVALNRWQDGRAPLEKMLANPSPAVVRAAMQALGVVGDGASVSPIVEALSRFPEDRYMVHSAIYAIIEIGDFGKLSQLAKESSNLDAQHACLVALEQRKQLSDDLFPVMVQALKTNHVPLRDLSLKCLAAHPQGVAMCLPFLKSAWQSEDSNQLAGALDVVRLGASDAELQAQIGTWLQSAGSQTQLRQEWLLAVVKEVGANKIPRPWAVHLIQWLQSVEASSLRSIASALGSAAFEDKDKEIVAETFRQRAQIVIDQPEIAIALLAAAPAIGRPLNDVCSELVVKQITAPESAFAGMAETVLSRSPLSASATKQLAKSLAAVPPLQLQACIASILSRNDADLDAYLLTTLPSIPAVKTLAEDKVLAQLRGRPETVRKQWQTMLQTANQPSGDIAENLDAWLARLPAGDAARGYQVFRSSKAACSSCHQVGYIGGQLGPELSHIGKSRTRRDLVEAIVFPSFRMAQGFYPIRIRTQSGEVYNGLLSKQTDTYVELLCGVNKVCRIEREDIEDQVESKVSVMPNGLEQQMSVEEFSDLLAFLESKK